ncbi:DUF6879 family protein [Nocardia noduli]|uniref:DUF6879 family protein n=1 Tax=Nocardia noduli TaxID=2815722 RepID=UPI001C21D1EF|nr:DUF6879 family protein [Nocardia noduli]
MLHLSIEETNELLRGARRDAFHLEVSDDHSEVADESEPMRRVLAGLPPFEPDAYPPSWQEWDELVTEVTGRGVTFRRVRIVTEPHTDYVRFLHSMTDRNIGLGEDIRWLGRHQVAPEAYTSDEWWLIDDREVAFTLFTGAGDFTGTALTGDPAIVEHCVRIRDGLWDKAIPHRRYRPGGSG